MLIKDVYTERVLDVFEILVKEDLTGVHFNATERAKYKPLFEKNGKMYDKGLISLVTMKSDDYCISLQPSLWNKQKFIGFMKRNETIWEMEKEGSKRASQEYDIVSPQTEKIMEVIDVTVEGKISQEGSEFLKLHGFNIRKGHLLKNIIKYPHRKCEQQ